MTPSDPRLQVFLSERGVASRRRAADWIRDGRVCVNGRVIREPGHRVCPDSDEIRVDDQPIPPQRPAFRTLILHKPSGILCSAHSRQGPTVCDLVNHPEWSLVPAGRLDKHSEGLVVLSNDGALIQRLTHPRFGQSKRYRVSVTGPIQPAQLRELQSPINIDGYHTRPADVMVVRRHGRHQTELEFTLHEGRNRQIRRLCGRSGLTVQRLVRVAIGCLTLEKLCPGQWRCLRPDEIQRLLSAETVTPAPTPSEQSAGPRRKPRKPHSPPCAPGIRIKIPRDTEPEPGIHG